MEGEVKDISSKRSDYLNTIVLWRGYQEKLRSISAMERERVREPVREGLVSSTLSQSVLSEYSVIGG